MDIGLIFSLIAELGFTAMIIYIFICNLRYDSTEIEKQKNREQLDYENILDDYENGV